LAQALASRGDPQTRAKSFMRVALGGETLQERRRAAVLWGLYACDAHVPHAAAVAFSVARPTGAMGRLAARRLLEALEQGRANSRLWLDAADAAWVTAEDRLRLRLRGAEVLSASGNGDDVLACLPPLTETRGVDRSRALVALARAGGRTAEIVRPLIALEYPQLFAALFPGQRLDASTAHFTAQQWATHAQAWLDAGRPAAALEAAPHGGAAATVVAARAALRLHHSTQALALAGRGGRGCPECGLLEAEAQRQRAWAAPAAGRATLFAGMLQAAEKVNPGGDAAREAQRALMLAEAMTELGKFTDAAPLLDRGSVRALPRWEWVYRRFMLLAARHGALPASPATESGSTRVRRLAQYWRATAAHDRAALEALAGSGLPDLPALWAAAELGGGAFAVALSPDPPGVPPPPVWTADLRAAGRGADIVAAWRASLEGSTGPGWLGLAALSDLSPLDAIPLLVRGEPRLLSGPWSGLSGQLLERYLPLPFRPELEAAARHAGVPAWLLAGVVRQESAWNAQAHSLAGALGLAQVLPGVERDVAGQMPPGTTAAGDLFDPVRNLTVGALLLQRNWRAFAGSWEPAIASYNAGDRRVREVWERIGRRPGPDFVESLEIPETWDYVHRVILLAEGYRIMYWPSGRGYPWT
jgi:soluble lytic murein transglycosylase-like protein